MSHQSQRKPKLNLLDLLFYCQLIHLAAESSIFIKTWLCRQANSSMYKPLNMTFKRLNKVNGVVFEVPSCERTRKAKEEVT